MPLMRAVPSRLRRRSADPGASVHGESGCRGHLSLGRPRRRACRYAHATALEPRGSSSPTMRSSASAAQPVKVGAADRLDRRRFSTPSTSTATRRTRARHRAGPASARAAHARRGRHGGASSSTSCRPPSGRRACWSSWNTAIRTARSLTTATRVALHPAGLYLGHQARRLGRGDRTNVRVQLVALDPRGKPLAGNERQRGRFERQTYSSRRRLLGGFYAYETSRRRASPARLHRHHRRERAAVLHGEARRLGRAGRCARR